MIIEFRGWELDDDPAQVDLDVVWDFLSTQAYWGRWRSRRQVEQQITNAWRLVSAFDRASGAQVGFARAFSDTVGSAYLADVFVVESARGAGLGTAIVETMIEHGPGSSFRWMLHTRDAHGLYGRFGFVTPGPTSIERPR